MTYAQSMQCPRCKSRYTQSVKMAYSQSVRTGDSGYQSISEFGKTLEPPPSRSEFGAFFVVAIMVTCATMILLPSLSEVVEIKWLSGISTFDWPVVVASVVLGLIAGARSAIAAAVHNASVHAGEMREWKRGVVCRRCGHRFQRSRP